MRTPGSPRLSWVPDGSVAALRAALAAVAPELARLPIAINDRVETGDPRFFRASAVIDRAFLAKFAWSEPPARRIVLEGSVLSALGSAVPSLCVPEVVATSSDPALFVTRWLPGEPLTFEGASGLNGSRRRRLATYLGRFLATLHDQATLAAVQAAGVVPGPPEPRPTPRPYVDSSRPSSRPASVSTSCAGPTGWTRFWPRRPRRCCSTATCMATTWSGTPAPGPCGSRLREHEPG